MVLFSALRLFTNHKICDFEWPFYVKFSLLRTALLEIIYILVLEPIYRIFLLYRATSGCAEADRDPLNICNPRKDYGSFVDDNLRAYIVEILTNKANIIL